MLEGRGADRLGHRLERLERACRKRHAGTLAGQLLRDGAPDALRGAEHQRDATADPEIHQTPHTAPRRRRGLRRLGRPSTLAVASEQAIQAAGPTIQPQWVKKREPSASASSAESTPTSTA